MNRVLIVIPTLDPERGKDTAKLARITSRCECRVEVVHDQEGEGFTKTVNRGIQQRRSGEDICLLNDDIDIFHYGWLRALQNALYACPVYGIVGPSGRSVADTGAGRLGDTGLKRVTKLPFWCALIRGEVIDQVGALNEELIHYGSDGYYCHVAGRRGWRCVWMKPVYLQHEHRGSTLQTQWRRKDLKILRQLMRLT